MKYIESLREGEKVNEVYLCKFKQAALTKAGKAYDNVILQDKTGTIDAKIWDPGSVGIDEFDALDYVAVTGDVTSFQGNLQMSIRRARRVSEEDIDPKEYLPCTDKDVEEMYAELTGYIDSVKNPYLNQLLHSLYDIFAWYQIYCSPGYDNQRDHAGGIRTKACHPVGHKRYLYRIYLWIYRCRRRYDDAFDPDLCPGL